MQTCKRPCSCVVHTCNCVHVVMCMKKTRRGHCQLQNSNVSKFTPRFDLNIRNIWILQLAVSPSLLFHARNDVHTVARVHDTATRPFSRLHLLETHPKSVYGALYISASRRLASPRLAAPSPRCAALCVPAFQLRRSVPTYVYKLIEVLRLFILYTLRFYSVDRYKCKSE